jgi:NAD(P)-dependent dehydrogenase (short-subunit alcohol dehydrogenase family)
VAGIEALAAELAKRSRIDILVNNAGAAWGRISRSSRSGLGQGDEPQRQDAVFLTQKLYGLLKAGAATGHLAKVINIASIDGLRLNPRETYSRPKAAVIQLTAAWRHALSRTISSSVVSARAHSRRK